MKRILYIMHVDWNWIKQRPQIIAEELSNYYEVDVLYPYRYNRKVLEKRKNSSYVRLIPMYGIPIIDKVPILRFINRLIYCLCIRGYIKKLSPSYIYLCSPMYDYKALKKFKATIIYDCMDNYSELLIGNKNKILENENKIIKNSQIILATSEYLKKNIISRSITDKEIHVIRNGISETLSDFSDEKMFEDGMFHMGYTGTIGPWFDFNTVIGCLNEYDNVVCDIYGPVEGNVLKNYNHPRMVYHGIVKHKDLKEVLSKMDVLVMPFIVNDVVKAVDPVKLYEYVSVYKNIICVKYNEVLRFNEFIYTYEDQKSFCSCVKKLINDNTLKYDKERADIFLNQQTWEKRTQLVVSIIERLAN